MQTKLLISSLLLLSIMTFTSCQKQPTANISASATTVEINEPVKFTNTSTDADHYEWNFGQGQNSTEKDPSHSFTTAGTFSVKMTAFSKKEKKTDEATISIIVNDINKKFSGSYNMNGSCSGGAYSMIVTTVGATGIMLNNFADNQSGWNLNAAVSGNNFTVPLQTFYDGFGYSDISGNGSLSGSTLTMNLTVDYTDDIDPNEDYYGNCTDTGTK